MYLTLNAALQVRDLLVATNGQRVEDALQRHNAMKFFVMPSAKLWQISCDGEASSTLHLESRLRTTRKYATLLCVKMGYLGALIKHLGKLAAHFLDQEVCDTSN
jgi:hypothetical protein